MASSNLQRLGLANQRPVAEKVAILVGPNGSGKSRFLRELAIQIRGDRDLAIISNTAHDRFSGLRGLKRITAGRGSRSPKSIVKRAIGRTIDQPDSRFYQIGAILEALPPALKKIAPRLAAREMELITREVVKARNAAAHVTVDIDEYYDRAAPGD